MNLTIVRVMGHDIPLILPSYLIRYEKSKENFDDYLDLDYLSRDSNTTTSTHLVKIAEISKALNAKNDIVQNFFGSMTSLMISVPETVRAAWTSNGYLRDQIKDQIINIREDLTQQKNKEIIIFKKMVDYYVVGLNEQYNGDDGDDYKVQENLRTILNQLNECTFELEKEKPSLKLLIDFLNKYSNKPIGAENELTFFINFLHQLSVEYFYEQRPNLSYSEYVVFCRKLAKIIRDAVVEIEQYDIIGIYNKSLSLWKLVEEVPVE